MAVFPLLLLFVITTVALMVLQVYLSMQNNKYVGLILPIIYCVFALFFVVILVITPAKNFGILFGIACAVIAVINYVIYILCQRKANADKQMDL